MPTPQPLRPIARRALAAQSDERLVRLLREGHAPAFEEIVRRYRGPLVGFATAIVSANGAEDVVQASLAKAHSALLEDSREINLRPWLFAIVRNGALNAIRGEPRVDELDEALAAHSNPSDIAEQRDELDRLVVAMCALPEAQRQALVKRELEGVGHGEIAAQLGTTTTAVRGLIFRARTQLRNAAGALVPLPILRNLLSHGTAMGAAGGAAGGGASAALLGGAGAKGGAAIAAAVLALGTGIAIEGRKGDKDGDHSAVALAAGGGNGTSKSGSAAGGDTSASDSPEPVGGSGAAGGNPPSGSGKSGPSASDDSGQSRTQSTSGTSSHPDNSGSSSGSGNSGSSGSDSGGSSGPGSGGHQTPTTPPPTDDGHSGHDGSGPSEGSSDHADDDFTPEPPETEDDSSGPSDHSPDGEEVDDSSGPDDGEGDTSGSDDHSGHGGGA